jgi:DNA-binding transcriptional regulator LsrR (DeoR family)
MPIAFIFLVWQTAAMTTQYQKYLKQAALHRKRIVSLYKQGYTQAAIARKMQVSRQRINQVLKSESE